MLSEKELLAIEARAKAATPGPWNIEVTNDGERINLFSGELEHRNGVTVADWIAEFEKDCTDHSVEEMEANAWFVSKSRTDIPRLIEAVRMLREILAEIVRLRPKMEINPKYDGCFAEARELMGEDDAH